VDPITPSLCDVAVRHVMARDEFIAVKIAALLPTNGTSGVPMLRMPDSDMYRSDELREALLGNRCPI
jgi:hypothetical protein